MSDTTNPTGGNDADQGVSTEAGAVPNPFDPVTEKAQYDAFEAMQGTTDPGNANAGDGVSNTNPADRQ